MFFLFVQSLRRPADLAADIDGGESGSDYGDWENDDWSVDSFAAPSVMSKVPESKPRQKAKVGEF